MRLLGPLAASVMVFARSFAGLTGCCGIYLEAHLACSCLAWKTPSRPKLPSASACELSLKVIGWRSGVDRSPPGQNRLCYLFA
jgi:hypothetical protein